MIHFALPVQLNYTYHEHNKRMKTSSDPRHQNRITLVNHLFASSFQGKAVTEVAHIWEHLAKIDAQITQAAPQWPLDKINAVDLAILRLAIYELTIDKTAPPKVIIDEAIEIAKSLGSESSPSFVNGVLGTLIKKI